MRLLTSVSVLALLQASNIVIAQQCGETTPCAQGVCCSRYGYCGTGPEYCGSISQPSTPTPQQPNPSIPRPKFGNVPYGTVIDRCISSGKIAITYDDGPWIYTSPLLDLLSSLRVPVTFFILGRTQDGSLINDVSRPWPAILKRMVTAGHQVASHSFSHADFSKISRETQISELVQTEKAFLDVLGYYPTYFRCPYLRCDSALPLLADYGYHVISTNADTKDYMFDSPDQIYNAKNNFANAVSGDSARNSYISLTHDIKQQTVLELTRYMIETARARGYELVTVGECLGDDRGNWYRIREGNAVGGTTAPVSSSSSTTTLASLFSSTSVTVSTSTTGLSPTTLITSTRPTSTGNVTIDASCGGVNGYTCAGSVYGDCCSHYGWCGSTKDYCAAGCNRAFGKCD